MTARTAPAASPVAALRAAQPLVHCVTNDVTAGRVADALAALGALPVMATAGEEIADFARSADALLLNCGTPSSARWDAMHAAAAIAASRGVPVVVDPVGVGASAWRTAHARSLVAATHALVRGNAPEVAALAGIAGEGAVRGVTAVGVAAERVPALAASAAAKLGAIVLVSGAITAVSDGTRGRSCPGAPPSFPAVGLGDVLGAVIAAVACVERDPLEAAWAAREIVDRAVGEAGNAGGAGTFWPAFLDALGRRA